MLNVYYGDMPEVIYNPAVYFKNTYEDEWIMDDFSRQMILDVDKSVVISPRIIDSPVLGGITPRELSGGVKTLILIHRIPDKIFNASTCGDNCAKCVQQSDNYFVIVTREGLETLPYSVEEIYGIRESGKYSLISRQNKVIYVTNIDGLVFVC